MILSTILCLSVVELFSIVAVGYWLHRKQRPSLCKPVNPSLLTTCYNEYVPLLPIDLLSCPQISSRLLRPKSHGFLHWTNMEDYTKCITQFQRGPFVTWFTYLEPWQTFHSQAYCQTQLGVLPLLLCPTRLSTLCENISWSSDGKAYCQAAVPKFRSDSYAACILCQISSKDTPHLLIDYSLKYNIWQEALARSCSLPGVPIFWCLTMSTTLFCHLSIIINSWFWSLVGCSLYSEHIGGTFLIASLFWRRISSPLCLTSALLFRHTSHKVVLIQLQFYCLINNFTKRKINKYINSSLLFTLCLTKSLCFFTLKVTIV